MNARDLEDDTADLRSMAALAEAACFDMLNEPEKREGDLLVFHFSEEQVSMLSFAVAETATRARGLVAKTSGIGKAKS